MNVVALLRGGRRKMADGLAKIARDQPTVVVNCGDDFDMMGQRIFPIWTRYDVIWFGESNDWMGTA
jgi:hypothetical protein